MNKFLEVSMYCDGGVIGANPSTLGGTFAWCHVGEDGLLIQGDSGIVTIHRDHKAITNNYTEMYALLKGLSYLPDDWSGTVYCDSKITLGRFFDGWKCKGLPKSMTDAIYVEQRRMDMDHIEYVLLKGHPTFLEIENGISEEGRPVSEHNVWCDSRCQSEAAMFMMEKRSAGVS